MILKQEVLGYLQDKMNDFRNINYASKTTLYLAFPSFKC